MSKGADYRDLGRFGVMVHAVADTMANEDWEHIYRLMVAHGSRLHFLIVWADGALTPTQRQESQRLQRGAGFLTLVFTDSAISRGVAKVLQWFGVKLRAEAKSKLREVLADVGATRDEIDSIRQAIRDLEAEMHVESLRSHRTGTVEERRKAR